MGQEILSEIFVALPIPGRVSFPKIEFAKEIEGGEAVMKTKFFVLAGTLAVFVALSIVGTPQASAQAVFGSIFGTVTDPSGAAVPGAKVVVTSATKGTSVEATTNADGNYSVTHLIPDVYNVRAEGAGFKAFEAKGIVVSADAAARVDGQFQVGGSTETVEVTAEVSSTEDRSRRCGDDLQ